MKLRDKYGWPVERIIGKPITNFIRLVLHTNLKQTWQSRNPPPATPGDANNLSPVEIRLLNEGLADVRAGRTVPLEQVREGRLTEPSTHEINRRLRFALDTCRAEYREAIAVRDAEIAMLYRRLNGEPPVAPGEKGKQ